MLFKTTVLFFVFLQFCKGNAVIFIPIVKKEVSEIHTIYEPDDINSNLNKFRRRSTQLTTTNYLKCEAVEFDSFVLPESYLGSVAVPSNIVCLKQNYEPIRILCSTNRVWKNLDNVSCSNVTISALTKYLFNFLNQEDVEKVVDLNIINTFLKNNPQGFKAIDIYYIAKILEENINNTKIEQVADIFDNLMTLDQKLLSHSQQLVNSTDLILNSFERLLLQKCAPSFTKTNFVTSKIEEDYCEIYVDQEQSYKNDSLPNIHLISCESTSNGSYEKTITNYPQEVQVAIVSQNNLFNSKDPETVKSKIFTISKQYTNYPKIYLKIHQNSYEKFNCGFWRYGLDDQLATYGKWQVLGEAQIFKSYYICEVHKSGSYAFLVKKTHVQKCPTVNKSNYILPETNAGEWATPKNQICLNANYEPVKIQCLSNATWNVTNTLGLCEQKLHISQNKEATIPPTDTRKITTFENLRNIETSETDFSENSSTLYTTNSIKNSESSTDSTTTTPTTTTAPTTTTTTATTTTTSTTSYPSQITCPNQTFGNLLLPETSLGAWTAPTNVICLKENYDPVRIQCLPEGKWNYLNDTSCSNFNISALTKYLFDAINSKFVNFDNIDEYLVYSAQDFKAVDTFYLAKILEQELDQYESEQVANVFDHFINLDQKVLFYSQQLLNTTDIILNSFERWFGQKPHNFTKTNFFTSVIQSNYCEILVKQSTNNFTWLDINNTDCQSALNSTNFEMALIDTSSIVSVGIFFTHNLFTQNNVANLGSKIVTLFIQFYDPIKIYFKALQSNSVKYDCAFWRYGLDNQLAISGSWQKFSKAQKFKQGYYICEAKDQGSYTLLLNEAPVPKCPSITILGYIFPETSAGAWATPENEICLNSNYEPVRIRCLQNGTWNLPENLTCSQKPTEITQNLFDSLTKPPSEAITAAKDIIEKQPQELKAVDVHFVAKILNQASSTLNITQKPDEFVQTVSSLMNLKAEVLETSQDLLNSTDSILDSLDILILSQDDVTIRHSNLLVKTIPNDLSIFGMKISKLENTQDFNSFKIEYLYSNFSTTLETEDFEIAFIANPDIENRYFLTLFYNNLLFNSKNQNQGVESWIVSILQTNPFANQSIQLYFKGKSTVENLDCNFWNYGIENEVAISGYWKKDNKAQKFKAGYYLCEFNHTTHFGMLVSDTTADNLFLDLITIFGSVLSVFGIAIIFLTALVFKQWRHKSNTKIILNISSCLLLLIIFFNISGYIPEGSFCIFVGIFLHYIVLAQFFWSLAISYSSYRKFKIVSLEPIDNVVLKFCGFSWGSPIAIIIVIAAVNIETYNKTSNALCYPKDIYLKLGVCLPMTIIVSINIVIYCLIVKNLTKTTLNIRKHTVKTTSSSIQKSLILLFFIMGLSWVFGLIVVFTDITIFLYLFCMFATLHGFVVFIFYICDSTEIVDLWKAKFGIKKEKTSSSRFINGTTTDSSVTT